MNWRVVVFFLAIGIGYALSFLPPVWLAWGASVLIAFWLGGLNVTLADKLEAALPSKPLVKPEQPSDATSLRSRAA